VSWKDANGEMHQHRYDRLVLASGSHVNRDVAGAAEHAFDLDQLESAAVLEQHLQDLAHSRKRGTQYRGGLRRRLHRH
jgi:NADH dehydrogenase